MSIIDNARRTSRRRALRAVSTATVAAILTTLGAGCAQRSYPDPATLVLQDPLPGQSLIYLIRAPHDDATLTVREGARMLAAMPAETWTAISVAPGEHVLETRLGDRPGAPPVRLRLAADQRYFLVMSASMDRPGAAVQIVDAATRPLTWYVPLPSELNAGSRHWSPYSETDARPMISIARMVLPER